CVRPRKPPQPHGTGAGAEPPAVRGSARGFGGTPRADAHGGWSSPPGGGAPAAPAAAGRERSVFVAARPAGRPITAERAAFLGCDRRGGRPHRVAYPINGEVRNNRRRSLKDGVRQAAGRVGPPPNKHAWPGAR